ncbi:MAG TPA: PBP1A family penicillin-binding protein [Candidatus Woesebacteria bacterium]|nr:PBP1A family penicillin-binding protein [Candidatus Woesebacteria bacterium]HNS94641.1 PBP1A family penicillin-binding protein [Candidatus Woesebacteria bacterium]
MATSLRKLYSFFVSIFARVLIAIVTLFILLGENTLLIIRKIHYFTWAHIRALGYVARHSGGIFKRNTKLWLEIIYRALHQLFMWATAKGNAVVKLVRRVAYTVYAYAHALQGKIHTDARYMHGLLRSRITHWRMGQALKRKASRDEIIVPHHPSKKPRLALYGLLFIVFLIAGMSFGLYEAYRFYTNLPSPRDIGKVNYALTSHVYDRNGELLFDFYKDQKRTPVTLSTLPSYVTKATIAIEDKDFYSHNGVSLISGIVRALRDTYLRNQGLQGGSTITQQLVKTSLLTPERTLVRKIKEIIIALETEKLFSKDEILEMYLNQVPYGGSVYGIEEASRKYFGKSAQDLTLAEAALLAGLPQAPTTYSPFTDIELAVGRRDQVLQEMLSQNFITVEEFELAIAEQPAIIADIIPIQAPHFVFYVQKFLENYVEKNDLYQGGYMIRTTLDMDIQTRAQQILQEELAAISGLNVTNGAVLVTRPSTGEILAMVGSVNFFGNSEGEFNVTTALRQPGSSIKPILYAYALQRGYTAASILEDTPTVFQISESEIYKPVNYDGRFHGRITLRNALANSYNIPAVKVLNRIGVSDFIDFARALGISTWQDPSQYGISLALGGGEVTMLDMAQSFGVLANQGKKAPLSPIISMIGRKGVRLSLYDNQTIQLIDPSYAYIVSDILSDNKARMAAFGANSQIEISGHKVAVKTGTTDYKKDNWTIGYTPDYLVVVWVGNNDQTPMNPYLTSGVTGAAPIWNRVMRYLIEEKSFGISDWYDPPANIIQKPCMGTQEVFVVGTENSMPCAMPTPRKETNSAQNTP